MPFSDHRVPECQISWDLHTFLFDTKSGPIWVPPQYKLIGFMYIIHSLPFVVLHLSISQVLIDASLAGGSYGDVAIDDVSMTSGLCGS